MHFMIVNISMHILNLTYNPLYLNKQRSDLVYPFPHSINSFEHDLNQSSSRRVRIQYRLPSRRTIFFFITGNSSAFLPSTSFSCKDIMVLYIEISFKHKKIHTKYTTYISSITVNIPCVPSVPDWLTV